MAEQSTVLISFIDIDTRLIDQAEIVVPLGLQGYSMRLLNACFKHAQTIGYTHWVQPYEDLERKETTWLAWEVRRSKPRYLGHEATREACEMRVIHGGY